MKRILLIAVIVVVAISPLVFYIYLKILEKNPPPPPDVIYNTSPVDVNQSGTTSAAEKTFAGISLPQPRLVSMRGFYRSYNIGTLSLFASQSTLEAYIPPDVFTVCIPRFWNNTDTVGAYMDISHVTLDNYANLGPRETNAQFSAYLPKFKTTTHLMVFGFQDESVNTVIAKKVWIFGCESL